MRALGLIGVALILFGAVVLVLRGISYTKEREAVQVGPVSLAAERKGFIPPAAGAAAVAAGIVLVIIDRRRT